MNSIIYEVFDIKTKTIVGSYVTRTFASKVANRKDLAYGAVRYIVRPVVLATLIQSDLKC